MPDRPSSGLRYLAAAFVALPLVTGCFTTHLWGGSMEEDEDGDVAAEFDADSEAPFGLGERLLLTPFAVLLDICTMPIQACLYSWDEDEECDA